MRYAASSLFFSFLLAWCTPSALSAQTVIRIMPPDGGVLAEGQRFDIYVDAAAAGAKAPALRVSMNGVDMSGRNVATRDGKGPANVAMFLARGITAAPPVREVVIRAEAEDGTTAEARLEVARWRPAAERRRATAAPMAKNIIFLLGDGMGAAHRTAARIASRGMHHGKAAGRLAMDTLDVTGMVMTGSLNAVITDSSPGMAAYSTGQKNNNNQSGVFPDATPEDAFDNPRIEYIGELLRRVRGPGFRVGIVTTADVTDSTPAANAAHTANRYAGAEIAAQFFDERDANGVSVLIGGGSRWFRPQTAGGARRDGRDLRAEFGAAGYALLDSGTQLRRMLEEPPAPRLLGLLHPSHLPVAFDKVGAGRYSDELAQEKNAAYRDTPMLEDMTRLALRSLETAPAGFYLMVEGASIDKRAHAADAERTIWDTIEFDRAVAVALEFAARTNSDRDPANDTLVIVTADHEAGGMSVIGVGNERYRPQALGRAVRDYAAVFRFRPVPLLPFFTNYVVDERGFPTDPDPSRKLLLGWGAAPDRYENWLSDRVQLEASVVEERPDGRKVAVANPARDAKEPVPGFLVPGTIENGATPCPAGERCEEDLASEGHTFAGHTATDVPLSASGPGAWQFTGVYENTDVLIKLLRAAAGSYDTFRNAPGR